MRISSGPLLLSLFFLSVFCSNPESLIIVREKQKRSRNSGGVLLSKSYGLTVCSLTVKFQKASFQPRKAHDFEIWWSAKYFNVAEIIVHPKCQRIGSTVFYDYACVRLEKGLEIQFSRINILERNSLPIETEKCRLYVYKNVVFKGEEVTVAPPDTCIKLSCYKRLKKCQTSITDISNNTYCLMNSKCSDNVGYPVFCNENFWGIAKMRKCMIKSPSLWEIFHSEHLSSLTTEDLQENIETTEKPKKTLQKVHLVETPQDSEYKYIVIIMTKYDEDYITTGIIVSSNFIVTNCSPFVTFSQKSTISSVIDAESIAYGFPTLTKKYSISKISPHPKCQKEKINVFFDLATIQTNFTFHSSILPKIHIDYKKLETAYVKNSCEVPVYDYESNSFRRLKGLVSSSAECLDSVCSAHGSECQISDSGVAFESLCLFTEKCDSIGASPLICHGHLLGISKFTNCEQKIDFPILFEQIKSIVELTKIVNDSRAVRNSTQDDIDYVIAGTQVLNSSKHLLIFTSFLISNKIIQPYVIFFKKRLKLK